MWANEPEIAKDWTNTYGSRIQKSNGGITQAGAINYEPSDMVSVPKEFRARSHSPNTHLAYITDDEAGILQALKPDTPHKGPRGIPNYDSFDAQGGYTSGRDIDDSTGKSKDPTQTFSGGNNPPPGHPEYNTTATLVNPKLPPGVTPRGPDTPPQDFQSKKTNLWTKGVNKINNWSNTRNLNWAKKNKAKKNQALRDYINKNLQRNPHMDVDEIMEGLAGSYDPNTNTFGTHEFTSGINKGTTFDLSKYGGSQLGPFGLSRTGATGKPLGTNYLDSTPDFTSHPSTMPSFAGAMLNKISPINMNTLKSHFNRTSMLNDLIAKGDDLKQADIDAYLDKTNPNRHGGGGDGDPLWQRLGYPSYEAYMAAMNRSGGGGGGGTEEEETDWRTEQWNFDTTYPYPDYKDGGRIGFSDGGGGTIKLLDGTEVYIPKGAYGKYGLKDWIYNSSKGSLLREDIIPLLNPGLTFNQGGRVPAAFGGIMDTATGRRAYGLGSIFKSVGKAVKGVAKAAGKVLKSDVGKAAMIGLGAYYMPGFGIKATGGFGNMFKPSGFFGKSLLKKGAKDWALSNLSAGKIIGGMAALPFLGIGTEAQPNEDIGMNERGGSLIDPITGKEALPREMRATLNNAIEEAGNDPTKLAAISDAYPYLNLGQYLPYETYGVKDGGRIGYFAGDIVDPEGYNISQREMGILANADPSKEKMIRKFLKKIKHRQPVYPDRILEINRGKRTGAQEGGLMDLGGMEKDYRNNGGFVPIGGEERADDVPARLSRNEFVFTADAVRGAGGGDIDKGAEIMENVMKNLEQGGKISEETQGNAGAQQMFSVSERIGEVI